MDGLEKIPECYGQEYKKWNWLSLFYQVIPRYRVTSTHHG